MNQFKTLIFAFILCNLAFISCESDAGLTSNDSLEDEVQILTLQPNARDGVDAVIWSERPDNASPDHKDFQVMGWTWYSLGLNDGIRRSLINFDLSSIPENAKIVDATLSLYYNAESVEIPSTKGHSQRDGSNKSILSRITSEWSEEKVTWNNQPSISTDNQVIVKASDSKDENYVIDVKDLVEDMVANPLGSHGFMYMLDNEDFYRAMIFASSDNEDSDLHPKLDIEYTTR